MNYIQGSQNKFKNDSCYISKQANDNKSIYSYITDNNMFINKNSCFDETPAFLNYMPSGIQVQNIDLENELRGVTRINTKCDCNPMTSMKLDKEFNMNICNKSNKILPYGYY